MMPQIQPAFTTEEDVYPLIDVALYIGSLTGVCSGNRYFENFMML